MPAAAVRQEERVLFELIGRKGHLGGEMWLFVKAQRVSLGVHSRRFLLFEGVRGK